MPEESLIILAALFLVVGALYSSVGHAGASGYLAVMALVGVDAATMRPTALAINILVAAIAFAQFAHAGHFRWRVFWPFAVASVPAAFVGGSIRVPADALRVAIGAVLVLSAAHMAWSSRRTAAERAEPREPAVPAALGCGGAIGLVSGLTGTGGGIFLSPVMLFFNWADIKRTAATASLFILLNSASGLAGMATSGWSPGPWLVVLAAAACTGGIAGAYLGSRRLAHRSLRVLLAFVLLIAGVKLVLS